MFCYENLVPDRREIRLVRFLMAPDATQGNPSIQLQLKTASLNDEPSYHALSYLWGEPMPKLPVTINDERFEIARSLYYSLGQLFRAAPTGAWLWIDAICINQSSIEETNSQVGQMRDIFRTAESVYISLGDSGDESDHLLSLMSVFGDEALKAGVLQLWNGFLLGYVQPPEVAHGPDTRQSLKLLAKLLDYKELRDPRIVKAITGLLGRPNWFRAWIVQEIALARRGQILCGKQRLDLDVFHAAITAIYFGKIHDFARSQPQWKNFGLGLNNNHFHIRGLLSRLQPLGSQPLRLLDILLSDMRATDNERPFLISSDPRDIIFALLGIATDADILGIQPDYNKTVQQVYTEATKAMMIHCSDYRLEYCTFPKETPELPSWVPDWQRIARLGLEIIPLSYQDSFHASRGVAKSPTAEMSGPMLNRRGIIFDSVAGVFTLAFSAQETQTGNGLANAMQSNTSRKACLRSVSAFAKPFFTEHCCESDLWRVMVAGGMITESRSEFDTLANRIFRQEPVAANTIDEKQMKYMLMNLYPYPRKLNDGEDLQPVVDEFCDKLVINAATMARGRTLFVTHRGVLGLGPHQVCNGDVVTILFGTQVPIILRPAGPVYTYVGEAYVDGTMEGQCMEGLEGSYEQLDFEIV